MKNNKLKISVFLLSLLSLSLLINSVQASEVTGNLSTGINSTVGNEVNGTVITAPTASPVAGSYNNTKKITLIAAGSTSIHYTDDGTVPTCTTGTTYSKAISISSTKTIKALSCYPSDNKSTVASFLYTITSVDGSSENVSLTSSTSGQADLPAGTTNLNLSDNTVMDVSTSVDTAVSGHITVGGKKKTLNDFTSGNLSGKNLSVPQSVGGQTMTVNKAVVLESGVDDQPFTLSNSDLTSVSVSIPDTTTVLAPSGWDGKIAPPKTGSSSGSAPSGFSVGNTVIEVGSSSGILLFDKPVSIVLSGVTGNVGYKPSGSSTWVQITTVCGGTYASPSAPTFPNECYISNGTDTKIYTYHFTSFASLNVYNSGGGTGGSSGGSSTVVSTAVVIKKGDANSDNKVDKYDFSLMMSNWGKTGTNICDFNSDSKVDKYDFSLMMSNWGK